MKNLKARIVPILGIIALVAVIGFSMAACGGGGGGGGYPIPQTVTYSGMANGTTYTLKITESSSRAAYTPQSGDSYELTLTGSASGTSSGTIAVNGITFTLTHSSGTLTVTGIISITVSTTGGITKIDGKILYGSTTIIDKPTDVTPIEPPPPGGGTGGGISGTYIVDRDYDPYQVTFSGGTSGTATLTVDFFGSQVIVYGTYTVVGDKITITITSSNHPLFAESVGEKTTYTIIDERTIKDDKDGDILKKK